MFKFLLIGWICMSLLGMSRNKIYKFSERNILVIMFFLTVAGVLGTMLLYYLENGTWGGTSFFGSILLIPLFFIPIAKLYRISYEKMMDYVAPSICMMLFVMKFSCMISGCCSGRRINLLLSEKSMIFPSQIVEAVVVLMIMIVLLYVEKQKLFEGEIYPLLLVLYGTTRFVLNFFRADLSSFIWSIPAGHFWAMVSIGSGIIAIKVRKMYLKRKDERNGSV